MSVRARLYDRRAAVFGVWLAAAVGLVAGCSGRTAGYPPLARVTGRVTLGGKPLGDIQVCFRHRDGGRMAAGLADAEGNYTILYSDAASGAAIGPNRVSFLPLPGAERVPKELSQTREVEVGPGKNVFDFELQKAP